MAKTLRVLLVDDDAADRLLTIEALEAQFASLQAIEAGDAAGFERALDDGNFDIVITDYDLGWTDGLQVLHEIKRRLPECPVIMFTGAGSEEIAAEGMKAGLEDYVLKSAIGHFERLPAAVSAAFHRATQARVMKEVERALRESSEFNKQIIDSAREGVIVYDRDLRYKVWSRAMEDVSGLPAEAVIGKHPLELFPFLKEQGVIELLERALAGETMTSPDVHFNDPRTGKTGWQSGRIGPLRDAQGNIAGVIVTLRDISDRKQAEQALLESESRLRLLVEQMPAILWTTDSELRVQSVAGGGLAAVQVSPAKAIGRSLFEAVPEESAAAIGFHQRALQGESVSYELEWRGRTFQASVEPLRNAQGVVVGCVGVALDITDRKQAEDLLRHSEKRYRLLFERNLAGVFRSTPDGRVLDCNDSFAHIFGYESKEEVLGRSALDFYFVPEDRDQLMSGLRQKGFLSNFEQRLKRKDGSLVWVLGNIALSEQQPGQDPVIEGTIIDITQRKELEDQLIQAQKMEAIGRLAGGIAHDFNNLLTAVIGYSQLLLMRLEQGDPARWEVGEINKAAVRAATLTSQLLAFSRRQILQPKILDLNSVVADLSKMLRRLIGEDIDLVLALEPNLGQVKADPSQIQQVIMNLAVNARDAMLRGGTLTIETANLTIESDGERAEVKLQPGRYVVLRIRDTGEGMSAETQSHIFEPFFTTKEVGKGTGLGLSTVYGIISQTGGEITVSSAPGEGATFSIYLPRVEESVEHLGEQAARPRPSETILLVEDDSMVRGLAATVLTEAGYKVLEAASGADALQLVADSTDPIHLLLTDVVMPSMSGTALADEIRALRPAIRVLYASGYTDDAVIHHGVAGKESDFIQKPFTPRALAEKVREVLDR
jgi:PAS domain S-box-containing protein